MKVRKLCECALLIAMAILFQLIEASIPLPYVIPGFKLGLANCVAMIALYRYDNKTMTFVNLMRVVLAALMRGTLFQISFWLSFAGAICASLAMWFTKRFTPCTIYGTGMAGSSAHVIAQVAVIMLLYEQWRMIAVLPLLLVTGIPTGIAIAWIAALVLKRLPMKEG
ncbi:Gx transporter family protein [Massilicoli timonensis]|uniref:Gx transporter family protein n=1 Tax=Massilicoli timonensis TaxID=2015901 RepID=UPI000C859C02|nr:Gx transporter family protein [Massilicoli timonensis]